MCAGFYLRRTSVIPPPDGGYPGDLVVRDDRGEIHTLRYDAVNAMLLNEFLKAHKRMQDLEARDAQQQKQIETLTKRLREQAAQIQKVNAQHEVGEPAPQVATNNS